MTLKDNEKQVLLTFDLPVGNIKVTVDKSFTDVSCVRICDGKLEQLDLAKPFPKNTGYMLMARQIDGQGIIKIEEAITIDTSLLENGIGSIRESLGGELEDINVNYLVISACPSTTKFWAKFICLLTTARILGNADMVEFDVTLTKDLIPIIYHDLSVLKQSDEVKIKDLTHQEMLSTEVCDMSRKTLSHEPTYDVTDSAAGSQTCPTFSSICEEVDACVDFNVELKWPAMDSVDEQNFFNINDYCDRIIDVVRKSKTSRGIVYSSFSPRVCACLKFKQSEFEVIQLVWGDSGHYGIHHDIRVKSVSNAAAWCQFLDMAGVNTLVNDALNNDTFEKSLKDIRDKNLVIGVYGDLLNYEENRVYCRNLGLDLIIYDNIHVFNKTS
uniref:Hypothetical glycerophosphoryl diester phosphodiesterase/glycosyl hydrolase n=1 Tax=Oikopleura dioica TaxID=34765 RepID=Q675Q6_OIKDI|nr:hypothetical glycerophosphoryl diester phosphodiesterase/glycosyl hydrolase [Oikopleura dioica]